MHHDAAVPDGPARSAIGLLAHESVFDSEDVMRERLLVKDMSEALVEGTVSLVADLHRPVAHAKRVAEVLAYRIAPDLRCPACEILPVE